MVQISPDAADRIRRKHPLQYGYRGRNIVYDPGDDPTVGERYNRCPNCEQWSPCDVRELLQAVLKEQSTADETYALDDERAYPGS